MAWRIDEQLIRGEIDNRARGRVTGRLWFVGREEPVRLDLAGDAWRDMAGHLLSFTNPSPKPPAPGALDALATEQRGVVGDMTASRKVKVPDCTMDELMTYLEARKPFPWHWGNCLYLEWHGERNGRVVIEATDYVLELGGAAAWSMSEAEELARREANGRAMTGFMERLADAQPGGFVEEDLSFTRAADAVAEGDDEDAPTTEAEAKADAEQARIELLLDRVQARMTRAQAAGEELNFEQILGEERARLRRDRGEPEPPPPTSEDAEARAEWIAAMNAAAEQALAEMEATEGPDGDEAEAAPHPLVARGTALVDRLHADARAGGWLTNAASREHPLWELLNGVMIATAKLAGAFASAGGEGAWPPEPLFPGGVLVRLKKARGYLRDALAGLDAADEQGLAEADWRREIRADTTAILAEVKELIAEVRASLKDAEGESDEDWA